MCGRYASPSEADIEKVWNAKPRSSTEKFPGRFNAAPTLMLPVIRGTDREIALMRWGLIPAWSKDGTLRSVLNNARAETVAEKPSFRTPYKRRRCVVPMLGFYEWQQTPSAKVPYYISGRDYQQIAVAGIWERWEGNAEAPAVESFAIVTTGPNSLMEKIHDRMPVILDPGDLQSWLDPDNTNTQELRKLLAPCTPDGLQAWPVGARLNSTRNEGPELIKPASSEQASLGDFS